LYQFYLIVSRQTWFRLLGCLDNPGDSVRLALTSLTLALERLYIQRASVGRQFSGRATLEEAPRRAVALQNDLFLKHQ
jgi:hypothetical protein